jgi:hypothetical protein
MEYALLVEQEHMVGAQELDARYHLAKLFGLMMTEEGAKYAWAEHRELRQAMLAPYHATPAEPTPTLDRSEHLKLALSIQDRLSAAGILPRSGEMH